MSKIENFVVLDLENPNTKANSICSIAIIEVQNNEIIKKNYTLINPEDSFDMYSSKIHGITASMVQDKPTMKEYWNKIKDLLVNNIIIGHNITYDLSVLSKSLDKYNIEIPNFRYMDTFEIAKNFLNLDSYKLSDISRFLNFDYDEHNALEDSMASLNVFNYINSHYDIEEKFIKSYKYVPKKLEKLNDKLSTNINYLYGIIKGINYDGIINEKEILLLRKWVDDNKKNNDYIAINKIIETIDTILQDNIIDDYERIKLTNMISNISLSKLYSPTTLSLQILDGILSGIVADDKIPIEEINGLKKWLNDNAFLSDVYPYDKIRLIIERVTEDGIITNEEETEMLSIFKTIFEINNENINELSIKNKNFCLSGEFRNGSRQEISKKLTNIGGIEKTSVTSKLDYLFVGSLGSDAWKYGKIGGKIAKAQEFINKGINIKIISENDMEELLK